MYIEETKDSDAGFYVCKLSNSAGKAKKTFQVQVITKPIVSDVEKITHIEVILLKYFMYN